MKPFALTALGALAVRADLHDDHRLNFKIHGKSEYVDHSLDTIRERHPPHVLQSEQHFHLRDHLVADPAQHGQYLTEIAQRYAHNPPLNTEQYFKIHGRTGLERPEKTPFEYRKEHHQLDRYEGSADPRVLVKHSFDHHEPTSHFEHTFEGTELEEEREHVQYHTPHAFRSIIHKIEEQQVHKQPVVIHDQPIPRHQEMLEHVHDTHHSTEEHVELEQKSHEIRQHQTDEHHLDEHHLDEHHLDEHHLDEHPHGSKHEEHHIDEHPHGSKHEEHSLAAVTSHHTDVKPLLQEDAHAEKVHHGDKPAVLKHPLDNPHIEYDSHHEEVLHIGQHEMPSRHHQDPHHPQHHETLSHQHITAHPQYHAYDPEIVESLEVPLLHHKKIGDSTGFASQPFYDTHHQYDLRSHLGIPDHYTTVGDHLVPEMFELVQLEDPNENLKITQEDSDENQKSTPIDHPSEHHVMDSYEHGHVSPHVHDSRDAREHHLLQHSHDVHSKDVEKEEIAEKVGLHDEAVKDLGHFIHHEPEIHSDPEVEHNPYVKHHEMVDHHSVDHHLVDHGVPRKHFRYHPYGEGDILHFRRPYAPSREVYDREEMGREIAQSHWVPPHFFDQVLVQEDDHIGQEEAYHYPHPSYHHHIEQVHHEQVHHEQVHQEQEETMMPPLTHLDFEYTNYCAKFNKQHRSLEEYNARMRQFAKTDLDLHKLNQHLETSKVAHNAFSDWTDEERALHLSTGLNNELRTDSYLHEMDTRFAQLDETHPEDFKSTLDWTTEPDVVQPASEYSLCRSAWADVAASVVEGVNAIHRGHSDRLSRQQIVDCDPLSDKCQGGLTANGLQYAQTNELLAEADYEWTGVSQECQQDHRSHQEFQMIQTWGNVLAQDPQQVKRALQMGPVAASISAGSTLFQFHSEGVISDATLCDGDLNSAVTIVGYGFDHESSDLEYWIVKNSWGQTWGEQGFARIAISKQGHGVCNIQSEIHFALPLF